MTTTESIHKISLNELSPYVRLATFTDATKEDFFVPWRMIYDYEMYYLIEGEIVVRTRSQEVVLQPGDLHIMRPFIWHKREANTDRVKYYGVHFDFLKNKDEADFSLFEEYLVPIKMHVDSVPENKKLRSRRVYEPAGVRLPMKLTVQSPENYIKVFREMTTSFMEKEIGYELMLKADLQRLIVYILREKDQSKEQKFRISHSTNVVAQMTQILFEDYGEKIYLEDLAQEYGMSPSRMRKLFKKVNNISPRDFLLNMRIEEAKRLLSEGRKSITEISEEVGYENANYFSRIFKKKVGMSPAQYRQSIYK